MSTLPRHPARYEAFDERFADVGGDRYLRTLFDDGRWLEGPAYHRALGVLLFSDIPNDRVLRYDERTGQVDVFTAQAGFTNGRTVDAQGRFVTCEHGGRRVTRLEHDGSVRVLADSYDRRRLNSPNDVVVHPDGSVWFTDPTYGIRSDYEGHRARSEQTCNGVYRVDPMTGDVRRVIESLDQPNGIVIADGGRTLFVVDSGDPSLWRFAIRPDGSVDEAKRIASPDVGFDGIRIDRSGRLWVAAEDGVRCLDSEGTLLGRIPVPETVANLEFGGPQRNILYITATTSLYALRVSASA